MKKALIIILCMLMLLVMLSCDEADEDKVKVFFFTDGGTPVPVQKLDSGAVATVPTPPTKASGTFIGWYYNGVEWDFSTPITKDTILIAKWDEAGRLIFDYSNYEGVVWDLRYEEEITVEIGKKVGELPRPSLDGYTFDGWYKNPEDITTKVDSTFVMSKAEDIVLYPLFKRDYSQDANQHIWETTFKSATCTQAGQKLQICTLHPGEVITDSSYSARNPALGHQWSGGQYADYYGWVESTLCKKRSCERAGCGLNEVKEMEDITSLANVTVRLEAGGWPGVAEWPAILTDGIWEGTETIGGCAPKGGGPLEIQILFDTPQYVDQLAMSVSGVSGYGYKICILDENLNEHTDSYGTFLTSTATKDTAVRVNIGRRVYGIAIVQEQTSNGVDRFYEIAVGRFPDEE